MENSNDVKNTTNVGNEDLVDVSGEYCPICGSDDLLDIDDHYTHCQKCGFQFVM